MLNHVYYVWLYYTWFFVFDCIGAVLRGSLYNSCGLSAVKINEQLSLGRVALGAQRPIIVIKLPVDDLSVSCVCRSVGLSSVLWRNGGSNPDAVWHHRPDGSRD